MKHPQTGICREGLPFLALVAFSALLFALLGLWLPALAFLLVLWLSSHFFRDPERVSPQEELLRPTKIYVRPVLAAIEAADIRGISHITGGGFYENIPRCIPDGLCAKIEKKALRIPPIFPLLSRMGGISERDMFNTFNMGTGMVLVAAKDSADKALAALHSLGQEAGVIGEIVLGEEKVELC